MRTKAITSQDRRVGTRSGRPVALFTGRGQVHSWEDHPSMVDFPEAIMAIQSVISYWLNVAFQSPVVPSPDLIICPADNYLTSTTDDWKWSLLIVHD